MPQISDLHQNTQAKVDTTNSEEIDLLSLLCAAWKTWKHCLLAAFLVSITYFGIILTQNISGEESIVYSKVLKLTFPGAENLKYPNDSHFQYGDIIAPAVLQEVFEVYKLKDYGLTESEFQTSLLVEPYAPEYSLITARYNRLLSDKNLLPEAIADLQATMKAELEQATKGSVLISFRTNKSTLPATIVKNVLADIPAIWARHAIKDKGVLDLNIQLASEKALDSDLIQNVDYMVISDLLKEKTTLIAENINKLSKFDGAATIEDPVTGLRLADLQQNLDDLQRYVIDELMSPIRSLGLTRNLQLSLYYYEDKRRHLVDKTRLYNNQALLVKNAFISYFPNDNAATNTAMQTGSPYSSVMPQFNADALEKMLSLSNQAKIEEYRQSLSQQWLTLNMKAAELESQVQEVDHLIAALKGTGDGVASQALKDSYLKRAEESLPKIIAQLENYLETTQRIYHQLSAETVGVTDRLYIPMSNEVLISKVGGLDVKRSFSIWVALMFLVIIIVVPTVMIRNALRDRAGSEST